ncbi:outer membrane lipoprotein-sorting protein [Puniceicoccales bacterium CK1056]|uniref:Outer membrane lipoprotein-sorting protein n=1 Tax=Oceanipulchritudo coccoides TaxID=2706888 RepID=A0A6B2M3G9_9BACT|nr:hypothetical protein [Oceanipulchritudo coccoides]NDV63498.1 outer membrane lipoprotein-sorting protein [Oceanipulchritudo coccoides]
MGQSNEEDVIYVLERYIESMGGRAALEEIRSVRLSGEIIYSNGVSDAITVLKKKPNLVRVILDKGQVRFVQAYDGKVAWYARESGRNSFHDRMRGQFMKNFIRQAPLENVLVNYTETDAEIELGEDVEIAGFPCYKVIARFPDGSSMVHHIEKKTFLERRILEYDQEGTLLSELIPASFESIEGVTFARKISRISEGKTLSTLTLDEIQVNAGILNTVFSPPVELPPQ